MLAQGFEPLRRGLSNTTCHRQPFDQSGRRGAWGLRKALLFAVGTLLMLAAPTSIAAHPYYDRIAKLYPESALSSGETEFAEMQGKCLVGLKEINFRKKQEFDPVAEWTNYRSLSLLEQFPPCTVLIMMETARQDLIEYGVE